MRQPTRRPTWLVAAFVTAALLAAGCEGDDPAGEAPAPDPVVDTTPERRGVDETPDGVTEEEAGAQAED
jgi:hypothetical protein